jgi:hypothetical protein
MHSFIFAYGSKQLGEWMLSVKNNPTRNIGAGIKIASQLYLGLRPAAPRMSEVDPRLKPRVEELMLRIREFSHQVKMMFKEHEESLITNQLVQQRISLASLWLHAMTCSLSKLESNMKNGLDGAALDHELAVVEHLCAMGNANFNREMQELRGNHDDSTRKAGESVLAWVDTLPNSKYALPETSPNADARGRDGNGFHANQDQIRQFGEGTKFNGSLV